MTRSSTETALALYLRRLSGRSPLGDEERAALLATPGIATLVDVERDFVRVGEPVHHACLIIHGLVARFAQTRNGDRGIVAIHIPGDMADLHSVVAPQVTWALHALTPTRILRIPHEALRELATRYPSIAAAFWRDCAVDASILAHWNANLGRKNALARIAHLFAEMHVRYQLIGEPSGGFPFPITQVDLADAVGLTPVHLNRMLKRLADDGVAVKNPDHVRILDEQRLIRLGQFDPAYIQPGRR
ncbi:Crp/Fnr family transcriptional regulator [Sphingomonas sp. GC_Shp_3]|uniref:Crp/Fnr family transcriptional regulator n=1 Tax=Sphingomonas sp. GC_Shp_3 TaxID=2937383 RepID=UPI002269C9E9